MKFWMPEGVDEVRSDFFFRLTRLREHPHQRDSQLWLRSRHWLTR